MPFGTPCGIGAFQHQRSAVHMHPTFIICARNVRCDDFAINEKRDTWRNDGKYDHILFLAIDTHLNALDVALDFDRMELFIKQIRVFCHTVVFAPARHGLYWSFSLVPICPFVPCGCDSMSAAATRAKS